MTKILHIITRLDMGGSAQNTLLTCHRLAHKYEMILACGLSLESRMSASEKAAVKRGIEKAVNNEMKFVLIADLVRRVSPLRDFSLGAVSSMQWLC